jgi:outer membrane protein assembly factor BamB
LKILSLFGRLPLEPAWSFTPNGNIWRLLPSETGEIIGEARDQEAKRVSFFALNSDTGVPLWQGMVLDEPWWTGIEDVSQGILLLHTFASPDMPQHQGIVAIDMQSGETVWTNRELTFWFTHGQSVYAHKALFEKRVVLELNLRTGENIREFGDDSETDLFQKRQDSIKRNQNGLRFPEAVNLDTMDPGIASVVRKEIRGKAIQGYLECAVEENQVVLNYHTESKEGADGSPLFDNHFGILDNRSGKLMYSDTIAHKCRAVVPDSFFIRGGTVYYIKDQRTLIAVRLP